MRCRAVLSFLTVTGLRPEDQTLRERKYLSWNRETAKEDQRQRSRHARIAHIVGFDCARFLVLLALCDRFGATRQNGRAYGEMRS